MRKQVGAILPLTLIIMAVLSVLAIGVVSQARERLEFAVDQQNEFADFIAINNAVTKAAYRISIGVPSANAFGLKEQKVYVDGREMDIDGVKVKIQDSAGLINLASASKRDLIGVLRIFTDASQASAIAEDIDNWRSTSYTSRSPRSGEAEEYVPRHSLLRSVDELLEIPGIGQADFYNPAEGKVGLRDFVLAGGVGWYNFATMPKELLTSLYSLNERQVATLISARMDDDWSRLQQLQMSWGLNSEMPNVPSHRFLMTLQGNYFKGRAMIEITTGGLPVFNKTLWQYPDAARY